MSDEPDERRLTHLTACLQDAAPLAAGRDPAEITALMDEYRRLLAGVVEEEKGLPGVCAGDQLTASWGSLAFESPRQAALSACRCSRRLVRAVDEFALKTRIPLRLAVGVSDDELESVALAKNCAARGAGVLVGRGPRELCGDASSFEELEPRIFRLK